MRSLLAGLLIREAVNLRKCRRSLFLNPLILNSPRKTERKECLIDLEVGVMESIR